MAELYVKYRGNEPVAYRYGEEWEATRLLMEGGYKTAEEAMEAYEEEGINAIR